MLELTTFTGLLESIITAFPMLSALVIAWILAERRAANYLEQWRLSEKRYRVLLREVAGCEHEDITNGDN